MKKLPRFLKRRWHGMPVVLIALLLTLTLASGSVVAYMYPAWTGTATVTVNEPLVVTYNSVSNGTYSDLDWTVSMYPGESEWLSLIVTNLANVTIPVTPTVAPLPGHGCGTQVTAGWSYLNGNTTWQEVSGAVNITANSGVEFKLTIGITPSCPPCTPSFVLGFVR